MTSPVWHTAPGITVFEPGLSVEEAIRIAGVDWTVSARENGWLNAERKFVPSRRQRSLVRDDTDVELSTVRMDYKIKQSADVLTAIGDQAEIFAFEPDSGGTYGGHSDMVFFAFRGTGTFLEVDPHELYLCVVVDHGRNTVAVDTVPVRVSTSTNTCVQATTLDERLFAHRVQRSAQADRYPIRVMRMAMGYVDFYSVMMEGLQHREIDTDDYDAVLDYVVPYQSFPRHVASRRRKMDTLIDLYKAETLFPGTRYAAYQSYCYWADWERGMTGHSAEAQFRWSTEQRGMFWRNALYKILADDGTNRRGRWK